MSNLVLYSIPAFIVAMLIELWLTLRRPGAVAGYGSRDTAASLSMGLMNVAIAGGAKLLSIPFYIWLYQFRLTDLGGHWWSWVLLLFAEDCCYYWFHRAHHEVRLLWAVHVNHHSSQRYNLSTALRQPLLQPFTQPLFWAPLPLLGFAPFMVLTAQAWSLLYQFWIHTELVGRLGPVEWIMNTPSHHRVHHGSNVAYLDRNHAGIFILWDRLFGTFAAEQEPVVYGLTTDITTFHPLRIGFHEVGALGRDLRRARTWRERLGYTFAAPGWSPDGSTRTARQLRADAETPR